MICQCHSVPAVNFRVANVVVFLIVTQGTDVRVLSWSWLLHYNILFSDNMHCLFILAMRVGSCNNSLPEDRRELNIFSLSRLKMFPLHRRVFLALVF